MYLIALLELAYVALTLKFLGFGKARRIIADVPVARRAHTANALTAAARAVDLACVYFPKKMQCLERAAVMTRILRRRGMPAAFVIGVRPVPFSAHAWVEINGEPAYGAIDGIQHYQVIDRA